MESFKIECAIIRGGTTKGVFLDSDQLPKDIQKRDELILSLFGSPDTRQINGLGGGDPLTSKVALIRRSTDDDADIDYQSGEVGIDESSINYSTMCGNLASGAGLFALDMGWIEKTSPLTKVNIRNLNTGKYLEVAIPIENNAAVVKLCKEVDGVNGYGVEINLSFKEPSGSITGHLLPTGSSVDQLEIEDYQYKCSIVDCGTLYVFLEAESFKLSGKESPEELDNMPEFKAKIELIRDAVAHKISLNTSKKVASKQIKVAIFSYSDSNEYDIIARVINRYKTHKAYPVTGAICLSAATMVTGSILYKPYNNETHKKSLRISHPSGIISTETTVDVNHKKVKILSTSINRTANILIKGVSEVVV